MGGRPIAAGAGHRAPRLRSPPLWLSDRTRDYDCGSSAGPCDDGLVLHDHGGSAGAFLVAAAISEETGTSLRPPRLRRRFVPRGEGHGLAEYVHSVVNPAMEPATSVHAYSPPLPSMTFYATSPAGLLVSHVETEWDGPRDLEGASGPELASAPSRAASTKWSKGSIGFDEGRPQEAARRCASGGLLIDTRPPPSEPSSVRSRGRRYRAQRP